MTHPTPDGTPASPDGTHASTYDAIVIGGGPAGSTCAAVLAAAGRSVLVLERERFPRFHIGESMLTYTAALLDRLGLRDAIDRGGFVVKRGAEFSNVTGRARRVHFGDQGGSRVTTTYQVERSDFDQILLSHARAAGATVTHGARVQRLVLDGQRVAGVVYTADGRQRQARATWVVDASGRAGVIAHQHARARHVNEKLKMVALYKHYRDVDEANNPGEHGDIQIGSHPDGWLWAIPIREGTLSVGAVTRVPVVQAAQKERLYEELVARIPRIAQRLDGATAVTELKGESNFCYYSETVTGPGYLVVGDAGCFADPVFSAGVYLGMSSGMRAGEVIAGMLAGDLGEAEGQDLYARFYKTGYDCYFRLIYAFYEFDFSIGRYLKSIGATIDPRWIAQLLGGDFWSDKNPLAEHLRTVEGYRTFAPFQPLYGCPVYPELERAEPYPEPLVTAAHAPADAAAPAPAAAAARG